MERAINIFAVVVLGMGFVVNFQHGDTLWAAISAVGLAAGLFNLALGLKGY